ncbi:MAG: RNA methyltransferase [Planctomycetota bacterium]|nr:MAG: RNA methyltransferase [Planctomycetota bacterium]
MPYDETLAERLRCQLTRKRGIEEKRMFGGIGFLWQGNMALGVWRDWLIVRVGTTAAADLQYVPHAKVMDLTGRPMRGWLMIAPAGWDAENDLKTWVSHAMEFVKTIPRKSGPSDKRPKDAR